MSEEFPIDAYEGTCAVCGTKQTFERRSRLIRETYNCKACRASLREREQAQAILDTICSTGSRSLTDAAQSELSHLRIYEPGTSGPFRKILSRLPNYVQSIYCPEDEIPKELAHLPQQNLENLTFKDESFDLVISSDILEHVRKPQDAFASMRRVLRPGGFAIFTVPLQLPLPCKTVNRVDTSGTEDIHILPPHFHGNGRGGKSLVYTDFGMDIVMMLSMAGFSTQFVSPRTSSATANRVITVVAHRPTFR